MACGGLGQRGVDFEVLGFDDCVVGVALVVFGPVLGQVGGQSFLAGWIETGECGLGGAEIFSEEGDGVGGRKRIVEEAGAASSFPGARFFLRPGSVVR